MKIALLPARGGSKRIPGKNLKLLNGKPLLSYALEAVKSSSIFDEIVISSDSRDILDFGINQGVMTHNRTEKLSDDFSTISEVTIDFIENAGLVDTDVVCCVLPSNPFLKSSSLLEASLILDAWDFVFPVIEAQKPIERSLSRSKTGLTKITDSRFEFVRTQDLPSRFYDAGQFYLAQVQTWLSGKSILSSNSFGIELPSGSIVDIDTEEDWQLAEILLAYNRTGDIFNE